MLIFNLGMVQSTWMKCYVLETKRVYLIVSTQMKHQNVIMERMSV